MNYGDVQSQFTSILNRRDITNSLVTTFMGMAIQRIQRQLRVPAMEKLVTYTFSGSENGIIPVPGDLLEIIAIALNTDYNQRKLTRTDLQSALKLNRITGVPTSYYRGVEGYIVGPRPVAGTVVYISYYADSSGLSATTDHNWLTDAAPDLLIYAALSYAADYFLDERAQSFEQRYLSIAQDLQDMADDDELMNAQISPAYSANDPPYFPYYYGDW